MIYLDVCCLNRPFDEQSQDRIRLESEAVLAILFGCEQGRWELVGSEVIDFEISVIPDSERREKVSAFSNLMRKKIRIDETVKSLAREFEEIGISAFDALHIACAECGADIFLTTDDRLLKKAKRFNRLKVKISNPVIWLMGVMQNDIAENES